MEEEGPVPVFIRFDCHCPVTDIGSWWDEDDMGIRNHPFDVGIMYFGM